MVALQPLRVVKVYGQNLGFSGLQMQCDRSGDRYPEKIQFHGAVTPASYVSLKGHRPIGQQCCGQPIVGDTRRKAKSTRVLQAGKLDFCRRTSLALRSAPRV